MKLSVLERAIALGIVQKSTGDLATMKVAKDLLDELGFSEKEVKDLDMKTENGETSWLPGVTFDKEIAMGDVAKSIIVDHLKQLRKNKKLMVDHVGLCEKFGIGE